MINFFLPEIKPITQGIISPAFLIYTKSFSFKFKSFMYWKLFNVAKLTRLPEISTGSNSALYVTNPVLPTVAYILFIVVVSTLGSYLNAIA